MDSSGIVLIDPSKCSGCGRCELACSHAKGQAFNFASARIHLTRLADSVSTVPIMCRHCDPPLCLFACPTGALVRDPSTGIVTINETLCVRCLMCFLACPLGGITVSAGQGYPIKCDLCGGEPKCVAACNYGALRFVNAATANSLRRRRAVQNEEAMVSTTRVVVSR
jgi:carbon-monoxide dehydrogenase iron sulfur subunit